MHCDVHCDAFGMHAFTCSLRSHPFTCYMLLPSLAPSLFPCTSPLALIPGSLALMSSLHLVFPTPRPIKVGRQRVGGGTCVFVADLCLCRQRHLCRVFLCTCVSCVCRASKLRCLPSRRLFAVSSARARRLSKGVRQKQKSWERKVQGIGKVQGA